MIDLYEVLEVSPRASDEVIKMAHKALSKKYHPDSNLTDYYYDDRDEKIKQINYAYEILLDANKRLEYDASRVSNKNKPANFIDEESLYEAFYANSIYHKSSKYREYYEEGISKKEKTNISPIERDRIDIKKYLYYIIGLMTALSVISFVNGMGKAYVFDSSNLLKPETFFWAILAIGFIVFTLNMLFQVLTDKSVGIFKQLLKLINVAAWSFMIFVIFGML